MEQIEELSLPKTTIKQTQRKRKRGKTDIITSTPDIEGIKEETKKEAMEKERSKTAKIS